MMSGDTREAWTKALELRVRGRGSEALAYCERALKLNPDQWRLWVEYGSALFAEHHFREGVEAYLQALTLHPCSAWLWDRIGGEFSLQVRYQKALRCYVVAECLASERAAEAARDMSISLDSSSDIFFLSKRAAEAARDISEYLQLNGVTKAETDRMVEQVRQSLPAAPRDNQQMVDWIGTLKLRDTDAERVSDLQSRAAAFLHGPRIISEPEATFADLIARYLAGAAWDDAELRNLLSLCITAAQCEAANREGAQGPARDAQTFYQTAAALLQEIQAEVSADRV
jgi:tetratricopeptide (TPR) repeat protein